MKQKEFHYLREASEAISTINGDFTQKQQDKVNTVKKEKEDLIDNLDRYRKQRELNDVAYTKFSEAVYADLLGSALKGIYISALEQNHSLTKDDIALADKTVNDYINEAGSPKVILNRMSGKTYLLDRISTCVKEAHDDAMEDVDKDDPETFDKDVDTTSKEDMFDKLENDDDIDNAVDIIAARVGDAETDFIRKNAESKQKINDIIDKVNSDIADVKKNNDLDQADKDEEIDDAKKESARLINDVKFNGSTTIFENMVYHNTEKVLKNKDKLPLYTTEDGSLDVGNIMNRCIIKYGFLEFVNTIQLEDINRDYIKNILENAQ